LNTWLKLLSEQYQLDNHEAEEIGNFVTHYLEARAAVRQEDGTVPAVCGTCKRFRRHYMKRGEQYLTLQQGHCVFPRHKPRKEGEPACSHYQKEAEKR